MTDATPDDEDGDDGVNERLDRLLDFIFTYLP
jgi:hypothetical protein